MASISSIQKLLRKEDCEKILRRSINKPVYFLSYKITKFYDGVAGFLGDHLQLSIKFISSNDVPQKITYFIKTLPQFNLNQLDYVVESGIFKKEVILYQNLMSELVKIFHFGPKCYFIKDNLMVFEDLRAKGFKMLPKLAYFKEENVMGTLRSLAAFHASTLVYEKKWGIKLNEKFKEEIKETCFSFTEGEPRFKWLNNGVKCIIDLFHQLPNTKNWDLEDVSLKFRKFIFGQMPTLLSPSQRFRNVLTHDDLWCNNLLFNDNNECIIVDFQLVRYTPPCMDFLTFLYLNLETFYIENNLDKYVSIYYSYLEEVLKSKNLSITDELPRSEFEESLEHYKLAALIETALYGTHVYISEKLSNEIIDDINNYNEFSFINRSRFAVKEFQDNEEYRGRLDGPLTLLIEAIIKNSCENNINGHS